MRFLSLKSAIEKVKMKLTRVAILICIFGFLTYFVNGMPTDDCEIDEDNQISRFFKRTNCALNPHVENIKSSINNFRGQVWNKFEDLRGRLFNKNKDTGDIDFDELDVEDVTTIRSKRDDEEGENVEELTTVEIEIHSQSNEYLDIGTQNLLRVPLKCTDGQKVVGGRCRQIY